MLPVIRKRARIAFCSLDREARAEAVQEVVAGALAAYVRLVESGRADLAYPTPLAMYGIRQFRAGRRVGGQLNVRDVTSRHCQLVKGVRVERLDHFDQDEAQWKEILLEDRRAGPAATAAARIDFGSWMAALPSRLRAIASTLARGDTTTSAARQFGVSPGRISQFRRELSHSWQRFQGETPTPGAVA